MTSERQAYVYIQLPGALETVPAARLKVQTLPDGTQIGRLRYGDRYLERPEAVALDPFRIPLARTFSSSHSSRESRERCGTPAPMPGVGV